MRRGQRWAVPAVLAMAAAGVVAVSSPVTATASAATAIPAQVTGAVVDLGVSGATSMVTAGGKLFIGVGDQVQVRDLQGKLLHTIGNETGVSQLTVSEDGTLVYAADRGADVISVISAATGQETARWPTSPCPTSVAVASNFLIDSYGCGSSGSIETMDEYNGGTPAQPSDQADFTFSAPPMLTASQFLLVAAVPGSSTIASAFIFSNDPSFAGSGDVHVPVTDVAISPDANSILFASPGATELDELEPYSFTSVGTYQTGAPASAVAFSSQTLNRLMDGLDGPGPATMQVFGNGGNADGNPAHVTSTAAAPPGGTPLVAVPHGLTFGPDAAGHADTMIYGLATEKGSTHDYLEIGLAIPQAITHLSLALGAPTGYGKPLLAAVTFPGHPNVPVRITVVPNSGASYSVTVRTNRWNIAAASIPVTFNGRVYAYYAGDLLTYHDAPAASPTGTYSAPSHTTAALYGSYSTHGGVMYFHTSSQIHLHVLMTPPHAVPIKLVLRVYANGMWLVQPTATFLTNKWGDLEVFLTTATKGYLYQITVDTPANVFNSAAIPVTTPVFAIG